MTVKELIEKLESLDGDVEIMIDYPSGDYWHNTLARAPHSPRYEDVKFSDYHGRDKIIEREDGNVVCRGVVVI